MPQPSDSAVLAAAQTTSTELKKLIEISARNSCVDMKLRIHFLNSHADSHEWTGLETFENPAEFAERAVGKIGDVASMASLSLTALYGKSDECKFDLRKGKCSLQWDGLAASSIAEQLKWQWGDFPQRSRASLKAILYSTAIVGMVGLSAIVAWIIANLQPAIDGRLPWPTFALFPFLVLVSFGLHLWATLRKRSISLAIRAKRRPFINERPQSAWDAPAIASTALTILLVSAAILTAVVNLINLAHGP